VQYTQQISSIINTFKIQTTAKAHIESIRCRFVVHELVPFGHLSYSLGSLDKYFMSTRQNNPLTSVSHLHQPPYEPSHAHHLHHLLASTSEPFSQTRLFLHSTGTQHLRFLLPGYGAAIIVDACTN
jgi:hypothetical protein